MRIVPSLNETRVGGWSWRTGGAAFGLCLGIISPLVGSILTAIAWITGPQWHGILLRRDGTVLLFLTIPFLVFGAHCLDLMDRIEKPPSHGRPGHKETSS